MKVRIVNVSRRPSWPIWAVAVVGGWLILVGLSVWLSGWRGWEGPLCLFKAMTGRPCPTCGSTRGVLAILHGHVGEAFAYNPMVFLIAVVAGLMLAMRVLFARSVKLELTCTERRVAWGIAVAAFLANWAYLIVYVG